MIEAERTYDFNQQECVYVIDLQATENLYRMEAWKSQDQRPRHGTPVRQCLEMGLIHCINVTRKLKG